MKIFLIILFIFTLYQIIFRFYKKIGRRCKRKGCGAIFKQQRKYKIILASDEAIQFRSPRTGKRRWFIRRVRTITYTYCTRCKCGEIVKVTNGPISVVHAWSVKFRHPDQYKEDWSINLAADDFAKSFCKIREISKNGELDTPPINLSIPLNFDGFKDHDL
jgi:hypothetical protein